MKNIEKYKEKAEYFLDNDIRAFIKDSNNQFYFCDILVVGKTHLLINNFIGPKEGTKSQIVWVDIEVFSEYKEKKTQ